MVLLTRALALATAALFALTACSTEPTDIPGEQIVVIGDSYTTGPNDSGDDPNVWPAIVWRELRERGGGRTHFDCVRPPRCLTAGWLAAGLGDLHPPDLRAQPDGVRQHLEHDVAVGRSITLPAQRSEAAHRRQHQPGSARQRCPGEFEIRPADCSQVAAASLQSSLATR